MALEIQRVERPSREEFEKNFMIKNTPVILTGVASAWPAFSNWTPDYFRSVAGDSMVTVHYNDQGDFHTWYTQHAERVDRRMKFSDLIDVLTSGDEGRDYYMTEHEISSVSRDLLLDVDFSKYFSPEEVAPCEPLLFLGRDTCMPLHFHGTTEAFLCQLHGEKKVTLFSPEQHPLLYCKAWYAQSPLFSVMDGRKIHAGNAEYDKYPKFARAEALELQLHPGEILFIPVHWWHLTSVSGYQVSTSHFWSSKFGRWTFPAPGFQIMAREVLFKTKKGVRRIKRALGA